ncbi:30S ribosomal protein S6 [Aminiphilus circumscriptus]|uniref:30S ribosomal protein S6 n=1 Tax=Aminiphilus circumscriptus TaxID=290732 RepID=UPI0004923155|nr:30S ribosomal protein S6 [Aminiphilus circumscriptus]
MRPYEMMVLLHPDVEDYNASVEEVAEMVRGLGGTISKIDRWGKRRLAYPVQKKTEGLYAIYSFTLDPVQVKELERITRLKSQVMRHIVVLQEK